MANIYYLINQFLGKYRVSHSFNTEKIRDKAIYIVPKNKTFWWVGLPVKPGIYYYKINEKEYYICKTRLGFLFPSLYRLVLEPRVELVPHPIRWVFGCFLVLWTFLALIPVIHITFSGKTFGVISVVFWVLFVLVMLFFFKIDKKIALHGFINQ